MGGGPVAIALSLKTFLVKSTESLFFFFFCKTPDQSGGNFSRGYYRVIIDNSCPNLGDLASMRDLSISFTVCLPRTQQAFGLESG